MYGELGLHKGFRGGILFGLEVRCSVQLSYGRIWLAGEAPYITPEEPSGCSRAAGRL